MSDAKKIVLVVDDTPENILVISAILREHYKVKAATSGEKALRIASADPAPAVILLDVMMPEMDGHEVCRRLKAAAGTANIPVVFLTGKDDPSERAAGLALGAADYLTRPVDPADLQTRLAALTGD